MTDETLRLAELLAKAGDGDFLRSVAEAVVQLLMGTDVDGLIGAARHERSATARFTEMATDRAAELAQSPTIGGEMLAMEGSRTQKTPELIERTTKSSGRGYPLEAPHGSVSIIDAAMVLLKAVVQVHVRPMSNRFTQFAPDRPG